MAKYVTMVKYKIKVGAHTYTITIRFDLICLYMFCFRLFGHVFFILCLVYSKWYFANTVIVFDVSLKYYKTYFIILNVY
ncbi:hypothetical protein PCK1_002039 [Pneumocystis canis]|nr:hypothetical protein PCK1_002039 [Pneumocystis canis]